ncbi:hypothetical protein JHK82_048304 [Glycine max]|nr:hypothetical protein JHK82_048304 [Glycine max]
MRVRCESDAGHAAEVSRPCFLALDIEQMKSSSNFCLMMPKEEVKIEVPPELVEDNLLPLRYRPFNYGDYFQYFVSTLKENALDVSVGV